MPEYGWIVLAIGLIVILLYIFGVIPPLLGSQKKNFTQDYFKGLNYLLNEQTDKAIEVFTRMLEVEKETVDIHMALGNLFRRRGEVDRSIRIHQNLIEKESLSKDQKDKAMLELANDYLRAGLLDRAETILQELIESNIFPHVAMRLLASIYEQEKDWNQAIAMMNKLERSSKQDKSAIIAQYYCELAEQNLAVKDDKGGYEYLSKALGEDPNCVRASLILGKLYLRDGQYEQAIKTLKKVASQNPDYLGEVIDPLQQAYAGISRDDMMLEYLLEILPIFRNTRVLLMVANLMREKDGVEKAVEFMTTELRKEPSIQGIRWMLEVNSENCDTPRKKQLQELVNILTGLGGEKESYKCSHCGFAGKVLHWQCPGCRDWNVVKPTTPNGS